MSRNVFRNIWTRRRDALGRSIIFGIYHDGALVPFASIANAQVRFRLRTQTRDLAVTGLGTLAAYVDTENSPALYNLEYRWDANDPNTPGIYVFEIDAEDLSGNPVTFPNQGFPVLIRINEDVGQA